MSHQDKSKDSINCCVINDTPIYVQPSLVHFFSTHFTTGDPIIIPNGPKGHRYIYPDLSGTFKGGSDYPNFHGIIHGPSSDFVLVHSDGSGVALDVTFVMKTHDGTSFISKAIGSSTRDPGDPKKTSINSAVTFEVGEQNLKFLNNTIAMGYGKKDGKKVQIDYYILKE